MNATPRGFRWLLDRARIGWRDLTAFEVGFQVLNLAFMAPLAAWATRQFLERWGRCSVGNFEVAAFLLSPVGLTAAW